MNPTFQIIFIILAILIVLSIWFLIVKYFLHPLFFKPKLNSSETFDFLVQKNLGFVEKRELNKTERKLNPFNFKEGISLKKMFSARAEYIVIGFNEPKMEYHFFWLELTQWYLFHMKFFYEALTGQKIEKRRSLKFKEIDDSKILAQLKKNYKVETVLINDKCPACKNAVSDKTRECPNCGLNLVA